MNRKERRRNNIQERPRTVCVSEDVLRTEIEKVRLAQKEQTIVSTMRLVMGIMALALNNQFGFGQGRINSLIERINTQIECLIRGDLTKEDIEKWCKENGVTIT